MAKKLDLTGLSTEEIEQINSGISGSKLTWTVQTYGSLNKMNGHKSENWTVF